MSGHLPALCDGHIANLIMEYERDVKTRAYVQPTNGGFGNEVSALIHGFLLAMLDRHRLYVSPRSTAIWKHMRNNSLWTLLDPDDSVPSVGRITKLKSLNWLVGSPADGALLKRLSTITNDVRRLISCASHALLQPNDAVDRAVDTYLGDRANETLGFHLRSSDSYMMQNMVRTEGRRLSLAMTTRKGCMTGAALHTAIRDCRGANQRVFIAYDSPELVRSKQIGPYVHSIGTVYHTGRDFNFSQKDNGYFKALVDFFALTRVRDFFSNCDLSCVYDSWQKNLTRTTNRWTCDNTFAGNIWIRRYVMDDRSSSLRCAF